MNKSLENVCWKLDTFFRFRLPGMMKRYRDALAYARHRQSENQVLRMIWDCQKVVGTHCLVSIDADEVLERARDRWSDHKELARLSKNAAARVGSKWEDSGEIRSAAIDWAIDLVAEYAAGEKIELVEQENA